MGQVKTSFEPQHEKACLLTCAANEDTNQPEHPRSLIRVFILRMKKLCILSLFILFYFYFFLKGRGLKSCQSWVLLKSLDNSDLCILMAKLNSHWLINQPKEKNNKSSSYMSPYMCYIYVFSLFNRFVPYINDITKTCLYNFDHLKPHFYIVKLGFTGLYIIFLIFAQKHRLKVLVRTASPRRFWRVPTISVLSRNRKNNIVFFYANFQFLDVKFSLYLNRCVFAMSCDNASSG